MRSTTEGTWGEWSLNEHKTALMHKGGPYGIELSDLFRGEDSLRFWLTHIGGKGWGTPDVIADLRAAYYALRQPA